MPEKIRATFKIHGVEHRGDLLKVGLDDDRRPWRVEEPDTEFDGWLMSGRDLTDAMPVEQVPA